ncbi:ketose-bisphosphate aldolase [Marinococcus halophilus]|uniref:Fructose-bisphosphate aldolase n=1 Tax=Marinococcus halophilus TaxID=1371 RepID=A0A510Y7C4_MARHA|nr:class II fructose-bisphosphate aldolase [Marinococcus halophilus]OZT79717.1 ketose-bisphosphate aldolase [Marinococcus halophilus]GEK59073.1 fructose-bisphosphate aldolase [Marinococcus halophilus]
MAFIDGKTMLEHAFKNNYGVGAFSAHNVETVQAIIEAGEEMQSPIMIQVGQKVIQTVGLEPMKSLVDWYGREASIPIAVHLDHSRELKQTARAIQLGFQSVMFDGSSLPVEENIEKTAHVALMAKELGIGSEGEIGKIGGTEDDITVDEKDALITTVEEAKTFAEFTNVDYLAISIGTAHGIYQQTPNIRFERLTEIAEEVSRPIVLHGGSDVPDEQVKRAVQLGVSKINVDTELRQAFIVGMREHWEKNSSDIVLANATQKGKEKLKQKVAEKIRVFGSQNYAEEFFKNKKVVTL